MPGRVRNLPMEQAIQCASEGVVVTSVDRRITWANRAFERICGYAQAEMIGRSPGELLQCEQTDPDTIARMRACIRAGVEFSGAVVNRARNGRLYWIDLRISPLLDDEGVLCGYIAVQSDISERRRAEQAAAARHALVGHVGELARVAGWSWHPGARHVLCTHPLADMLGLELVEAVPIGVDDDALALDQPPAGGDGLRCRDLLRLLDRDGRQSVRALIAHGLHSDEPRSIEVRARTTAGDEIWMRLHASGTTGRHGRRVAGAALDTTGHRTLELQLQQQAELMREAMDAVDEGLALFDPSDRLVYCNEPFRRLYEASRDVIQPGKTFEEIKRHGARCGQFEAAIGREEEWLAQRLAARREGQRSTVQRLGNGRVVRVVDRRMPDGHSVGFRIDITDLVNATEAAERADEAKSDFIATVSHELRTPLQVILGFADLGRHFARDGSRAPETFQPMFEDIHAAGSRMLRLVNELLDVSKIDGSVGSLDLRREDVAPLVRAVVVELESLAQARDVQLAVEVPAQSLWADVDAFRLQQVLRNVLANAIRFAPAQSAIEVRCRQTTAGGLELAVRDRGPGIPPDELEAVFQPFVQSRQRRDGSGGTGLGLAISRRIMAAHAGSIWAELPEDGGTCLRLRLPAPAGGPASAPAPTSTRRALRRPAAQPAPAASNHACTLLKEA